MKIIIFGAGYCGRMIYKTILENGLENYFEIKAFCDNAKEIQGDSIQGVPVIPPSIIKDYDIDYIVITGRYYQEITDQVKNGKIIDDEKILDESYFKQLIYTSIKYKNRYGYLEQTSLDIGCYDDYSITVYTAITGDYDELKEPKFVSENVNYICFTNNKKIKSNIWDIRYIHDADLSDVMFARKVKILPQYFMECRGEIIWVDAKFRILSDLRKYILTYKKESSILCFPHFFRDNICDEMAELVHLKPAIKREVIIQTADYLKRGFTDDLGLYDTGCIYRDFRDENIQSLMEDWWQEILKFSYRDQLSFPYVCKNKGVLPDICDLVIGRNDYLCVRPHKQ